MFKIQMIAVVAAASVMALSSSAVAQNAKAPASNLTLGNFKDERCGTVGYITQIYMMDHNIVGEYAVGMQLTQTDGTQLYFTTAIWSDVRHSPNVVVLLNMAYTAYLAHTPVIATTHDGCSEKSELADGTVAYANWSGLLLGAPLK